MKIVMIVSSLIFLTVLLLVPSLHAFDLADATASQAAIYVGTLGWFATAPFWLREAGKSERQLD